MSITSLGSSILSILEGTSQSQNNSQTPFGQIASEFQQLGQDLQAGNLSQAQQDFTALSQSLANANPITAAANTNNGQTLTQAINQLGQDLRHAGNTETSQQSGSVAQEFSQLAKFLQSGNLTAAQQAFSALQNDLQQISALALSNATTQSGSGLNVSA